MNNQGYVNPETCASRVQWRPGLPGSDGGTLKKIVRHDCLSLCASQERQQRHRHREQLKE